jgi:hypothetical protein
MECSRYKEQITSLLTGSLEAGKQLELQNHLLNCSGCRTEFEATQKVWNLMGEFPVPSPSSGMQTNFDRMLGDYKLELGSKKVSIKIFFDRIKDLWRVHPLLQFACSLLLLVLGVSFGYFSHQNPQIKYLENKKIDSLSSQVLEMKQMIMLSLLENPSASERMRAVSYTDQISSVNKKVIDALITTLNEDANVNVRLVTLETLVKLSADPGVREGLVQSIAQQESPLVQSAIADAMVKLQEKTAVRSLQTLLHKKNLNGMVRIKIEETIHRLI